MGGWVRGRGHTCAHPVSSDWLSTRPRATRDHSPPLKSIKVMIILFRELVGVGLALAVVLGVDVEALGVAGEAHVGLYRGDDAAVEQVVPVDAVEERVRLDGLRPAADVPQPPRPVHRAQRPDDVLRGLRDHGLRWEQHWLLDDPARALVSASGHTTCSGRRDEGRHQVLLFINLDGVLVPERGVSGKEFIDQDA